MKVGKNHKGYSMVELIIVIAIMAILVGAGTSIYGHIRYANTKKAAETVNSALSKQQASAMSMKGTPYFYIYRLDDGYYYRQLSTPDDPDQSYLTSFSSTEFTEDGTKICGNNCEIYMVDDAGTETQLTEGGDFIRIVYTKNGVFNMTKTNVSKIEIRGSSTYTITLAPDTGKHFMEKG